jgi:hypothetical protein
MVIITESTNRYKPEATETFKTNGTCDAYYCFDLNLLIALAASVSNCFAFASDNVGASAVIAKYQSAVSTKPMCVFENAELNSSKPVVTATSGSCSHHHGGCGCASDTHQLCCDGAESPSCGCYQSQFLKICLMQRLAASCAFSI